MPYTKYHTWNTRQTVLPGTFFLLIIFYSLRMEITLSHGHDDVCTFKRKRWNHRNCYCTRHKCWAKFVFPFHTNRLFRDDKISQVADDFKLCSFHYLYKATFVWIFIKLGRILRSKVSIQGNIEIWYYGTCSLCIICM